MLHQLNVKLPCLGVGTIRPTWGEGNFIYYLQGHAEGMVLYHTPCQSIGRWPNRWPRMGVRFVFGRSSQSTSVLAIEKQIIQDLLKEATHSVTL